MKNKPVEFLAKSACRVFQDRDESRQIWTLTLAVKDLPQGFPYGPNARNADLSAKPAKAMLKTLAEEPQQFIYYNNGIMLVVDSLHAKRVEGGDFEIKINYCEPDEDTEDFVGHGVLNGGHTYKALMHALYGQHKSRENYPNIDQACVQVTVAVGIEEESVASISRARNLSKAVPDYALKNLGGDWQKIEQFLPSEFRNNVIFKPDEFQERDDIDGEPKYTVVDLVQRLALLNDELFPFKDDHHPTSAYSGKGSLVKNWDEEKYKHILPLLPDILWLEEKIMETHETINGRGDGKVFITKVSGCSPKRSVLITGKSFELTVAPPFVMPILAAFRVLIKDGKWIMSKEDLWNRYGERLVRRLWDAYRDAKVSSAPSFARSKSTWSTLINVIAMDFVQISNIA